RCRKVGPWSEPPRDGRVGNSSYRRENEQPHRTRDAHGGVAREAVSKAAPGWRLALAVLRGLAGLLETGLLAFLDAGVPGQEAGLLQHRAVGLGGGLVQGKNDAQAQRTGLAGDASAVDAGDHVVAAVELQHVEGLVDLLLVHLVREVRVERATVDLPLAGAGDDPDAGHGLLAAAGAGRGDGGGDR